MIDFPWKKSPPGFPARTSSMMANAIDTGQSLRLSGRDKLTESSEIREDRERYHNVPRTVDDVKAVELLHW